VDNYVGLAAPFAANTGDRILTAMRISSTVEASSGNIQLFLWNAGQTKTYFSMQLNRDIPAGSVLAWEFAVPASLAGDTLSYQVRAAGGDGAALTIAQFTSVNLTALGAA
jgi:hypothetical protein